MSEKIFYTLTDEAPALATLSFLPIVRAFVKEAGIGIEVKNISLAGRILACFPKKLKESQRLENALSELKDLVKKSHVNIIKLPNISASVPQLKSAIRELQSQGYSVPDYPEEPENEEQKQIKQIYSKVLGSAVNPVLRLGNSDRRIPEAVKSYARDNPHSMGQWTQSSKTHIASMECGDFYGSEKSLVIDKAQQLSIRLKKSNGEVEFLKKSLPVVEGEIIDVAVMARKPLQQFLKKQLKSAKDEKILFSVHLKATMMKISDPILFGEILKAYFEPVFLKHQSHFDQAGVDPRYGLADLLEKIKKLSPGLRNQIEKDIKTCMDEGPDLAMVDSQKGITNLHVPSDTIIDASMPSAIRHSGQMWNSKGQLEDMKAVIPDRSYGGIYQKVIDFCKKYGAFDPRTMGSLSNVGLMAYKAEEYGSHDKTFWLRESGVVEVVDSSGKILMEQTVDEGDIWRMCQTKMEAVNDWAKLALKRAKLTGQPALFWLDQKRSHDSLIIKRVKEIFEEHDLKNIHVEILSPVSAMEKTLHWIREGQNVISVTGNVLRDYLTDLFPIMELGTSAKMLSVVPLLAGGALFETGAGGSAPKHIDQFVKENHLRWDSLGEFLALEASLDFIARESQDIKVGLLARSLSRANREFLKNNKSPSRKVMELDTRGSHFYLALYWAEAIGKEELPGLQLSGDNGGKVSRQGFPEYPDQTFLNWNPHNPSLGGEVLDYQKKFRELAKKLKANEEEIIREFNSSQGQAVDMGGYYHPDSGKLNSIMRPSEKFNLFLKEI